MNLNIAPMAVYMRDMAEADAQAAHESNVTELASLMEPFAVSTEELTAIEEAMCDDADVSEESLATFMTKIADVILSLGNTFKSVVLKGGKRSEIKYVYESHLTSIQRIEGKSIKEYMDTQVDVPTGMNGTYPAAINAISTVYGACDVAETMIKALHDLDVVYSSMAKGSDTHEGVITANTKVVEGKLKAQEASMKALRKIFTGKGKPLAKKKVEKLFNSFEELKAARIALTNMEEEILSTSVVEKQARVMSDTLQRIGDFVKSSVANGEGSDYVPSKKFIKQLASYVRLHAIALTNYAECITAQMATEHNLGLVYTTLLGA